ncbi:MAG: universal stress protein [bacterium]
MTARPALFRCIVVPLDFSDQSQQALEYAVGLAQASKAEIVALHVVEPVFFAGSGEAFGGGYDTRMVYDELERAAREELAVVSAALAKRRIAVRTLLRTGVAHEVIVAAARRLKADLIVMSTHGRTGLSHLVMGSVAERVVRGAACPVLTMHGAARAARARTATSRRASDAGRRGRRATGGRAQ